MQDLSIAVDLRRRALPSASSTPRPSAKSAGGKEGARGLAAAKLEANESAVGAVAGGEEGTADGESSAAQPFGRSPEEQVDAQLDARYPGCIASSLKHCLPTWAKAQLPFHVSDTWMPPALQPRAHEVCTHEWTWASPSRSSACLSTHQAMLGPRARVHLAHISRTHTSTTPRAHTTRGCSASTSRRTPFASLHSLRHTLRFPSRHAQILSLDFTAQLELTFNEISGGFEEEEHPERLLHWQLQLSGSGPWPTLAQLCLRRIWVKCKCRIWCISAHALICECRVPAPAVP